jgi:chol_sulfatase: choline-sulfatase
MKAPIRTLR